MSLRIYELAKEFNVDSNKVIEALKDKGEDVKSHLSSVDADIGRRIIQETIVDAVEDKIVDAAKKVEDKIDEITLPISDFVPDVVEEAIDEAIEDVIEEAIDIATEVVEEVTESVEGFNNRRKQELIAERAKIEKRENAELLEKANTDKEARLAKLNKGGTCFFCWLFSLIFKRR